MQESSREYHGGYGIRFLTSLIVRTFAKSVLVIVCVISLFSCKVRSDHSGTTKCYERVTSGNGITDRLVLQVTFKGDSLLGKLDWLPQEKDSQRGKIKGVQIDEAKYSVNYDYTAEGVNNREDQMIVFQDDIAIISRGEEVFSTDTLKLQPCN